MASKFEVDVDRFLQDGFTVLEAAVPPALTETVLGCLEVPKINEDAWQLEQQSVYDMPVLIDAITEVVRAGLDDLAGSGQWHLAANWGFPIRLPGPMEPRWHIDGDWFTHHLWSGEQVLTPIFLWHDVTVSDGPTLLAPGTHHVVARLLDGHDPEGIPGDRIADATHEAMHVTETVPATGSAGDVYLCHPFLAHSINATGPTKNPRVISNVCVHGRGPIDFEHPATPVAKAVAQALE